MLRKMKRIFSAFMAMMLFVSSAALIYGAGASVKTEKQIYPAGEKIKVTYSGAAENDWVGIYSAGEIPGGGTYSKDWQAVSGTKGVLEFNNSYEAGQYDIFLLQDNGYTVLAKQTFTVQGANTNMTMKMEQTVYIEQEPITCLYTGCTGNSWIGIYDRGIEPKDQDGYRSLMFKWTKDGSQPDGEMVFEQSLAPGDYDIILFQDSGYTIIERIGFSVEKPSAGSIQPPVKLEYSREGKKPGFADGKVTITPPVDKSGITRYALCWGNSQGRLEGYSPIPVPKQTGDSITVQLLAGTFIPVGATKLLAYSVKGKTLSENYAETDLPEGSAMPEEKPLWSFQAISDLHVKTEGNHTHNRHFNLALQDIKKTDPNSQGIVVVGDLVDSGKQKEYDQLKKIVEANKDSLPPMYFAIGNHESENDAITWQQAFEQYLDNSGAPQLYYDFKIKDSYYIVLGSESKGWAAEIGAEQFLWLKQKLAEAEANSTGPIFMFLHQPMKNTVSGSFPGQGWDGVKQEAQLRDLVDSHPRVIFFSGHTHWELDSKNPRLDGKDTNASYFNTAAVGYLWTDLQQHLVGSQGLYVEIYADKILVRGRDFVSGEWISGAQFVKEMNTGYQGEEAPAPTEPNGPENPQTGNHKGLFTALIGTLIAAGGVIGGGLLWRKKHTAN